MTFDETPMSPAEIAAMTESAPARRTRKAGGHANDATQRPVAASELIAEGQSDGANHLSRADRNPIANEEADQSSTPIDCAPLVSNPKVSRMAVLSTQSNSAPPLADSPIAEGPHAIATHYGEADGNPIPCEANPEPNTITNPPHEEFRPYDPAPQAVTIDRIITLHRLRQGMIKAQTKLKLQAMAAIRFAVHEDGDFDSEESKAKARKKADALYRTAEADTDHHLHGNIMPYLLALEPLDAQRAVYEKELVRQAKALPVYAWAKSVKGFGDVSFATIVGECGDIGTYKSVAAVWKRLGLAVFGGKRQGNPGEGATKDDWIAHGYNKQRRSVSYVAREHVIGGMGKWRPAFGEDVHANPDLTYYQRIYAERARLEAVKLDLPVTCSDKGKESYKKHVSNRAHRYVEKRLLRELYKAWRR